MRSGSAWARVDRPKPAMSVSPRVRRFRRMGASSRQHRSPRGALPPCVPRPLFTSHRSQRRTLVKTLRFACLALFVGVLITSGAGAADDVGLITGGEKGTYYRFGLDLQQLMKRHNFNL